LGYLPPGTVASSAWGGGFGIFASEGLGAEAVCEFAARRKAVFPVFRI
jgi:hypothetical protein